MGINDAFSSWLRGAQSFATTTLRTAQAQAAAFQAQTMTALTAAQRAVTQPFQQQTAPSSRSSSPYTAKTVTPVDLIGEAAKAAQGGARAVQQGVQQIVQAHAPIAQGLQRDVGRAVQAAPGFVRSAPATMQQGVQQIVQAHAPISQGIQRDAGRVASSSAAGLIVRSGMRGIERTPMGFPMMAARTAVGAVQAGRDIAGYSSAVDRYKAQELALQRMYSAQKPLYDRYAENVRNYETSRATYDQTVAAYRANPTSANLAAVQRLEASLNAQYNQILAQDRDLTPLWRQSDAAESARREAERIQAQDFGTVSAAVIDALGAARMGAPPPASRRASTSTEQAFLYPVYPAAMGLVEGWRSGVVEPFERKLSEATGGRDLIIPQGAIDAVRHPVARGAITALAPGMASAPVAMDLIVGAKQWAGHSPDINISRLAAGIARAPADLVEMAGMAVPGAEIAARRVWERPSDLAYLPVAGLTYMGAGMTESFREDPEGTVGSLVGMGLLTHGIGRVSAIPVGRVAKAVRPRITEARIASKISPVDRPAFHAVSTIGRGIEGIRSDVLAEPRFGEVLNVGAERAPRLANVLGETPHSIYGSTTRTGQMRPGAVMRQAQDVDVFTPDVDALNLRIAREFGHPYSVEGATVVRDIRGVGRVHAIDTHAIPEGYPLPGAGRGVRIQYADAKVAPELPFDWMPKELLKAGRITQEHLYSQVQRKAASVAGEPVEGGWRFGPEAYRMGKDVFDLVSDAEYLISVEEARLPRMNPVRRGIVSRRLQKLRRAVEDIKANPTLSRAYRTELERAKKSVEQVAAEDGVPVLRISSMPAPAPKSPVMRSPSVLSFPGVSALVSADSGWVAAMPRSSPSYARGAPSRSSGAVVSLSPTRRSPSRTPSKLVFASPSPTIAGRRSSPSILDLSSPSPVRVAEPGRSGPKASPAPGTERESPSPGSPVKVVPSPYLYEPGGGITSPSPRLAPLAPRPSSPPSRAKARRKREDDERRRRREYQYKPHWELGPAPGTREMAGMIFGSGRGRGSLEGSVLDFGRPSIGMGGHKRSRKAR